jgi:retinol dehydrogenase 14
VRRVAEDILASTPRIDVLINNAGAMYGTRQVTADGLERTFALNHMAPFLLTHWLLERLIASAPSRILCVSSAAHAHGDIGLDFQDLQSQKNYSGITAYNRSKLANILFTRSLAKRLRDVGVTANCLHPGTVASRFFDSADLRGWRGMVFPRLIRLKGITPAEGARTSVYLASSSEVAGVSGKYFVNCKVAAVSRAAEDEVAADRLWEESLQLTRQ